jgi:NAD-dependent deacetylase
MKIEASNLKIEGTHKLDAELSKRIEILAQWIYESKYLVVFTGAGISTESGLADFRGPEGLWTLKEKGLPIKQIDFSSAEPNSGHLAIFELQNWGKLKFLISQNVDNLHLKSGIRPELISELHGNVTKIRCGHCEFTMDNFNDDTMCPSCGAQMSTSVVNFGQSLPGKELDLAIQHTEKCDLFIAIGSTLVVTPAADIPDIAVERGSKLVIINQGKTPLDHRCDLRFNEKIGDVLPPAVELFKRLMKDDQY